MYLRIYREIDSTQSFWREWVLSTADCSHYLFSIQYPLLEGEGFFKTLPLEQWEAFDLPDSPKYDPVRCGVFADWLQDNEDRLLAQVPEEDRSLAAQRLSDLRDWLRSGLQVQEV